ncbi:MAG TPA: hypothetical protein VMV03_06050 [Spirochaetia bacterium]|nr:hypothetical protein [Spirochaetia bacterium]
MRSITGPGIPVAAARAGRLLRTALAAAAAAVLLSCATVPTRSATEWMGVLPGDASIYISVSVKSSAALIKKTLEAGGPDYRDVMQFADWTKRLLASVTLSRGAPAKFSAVALGDYPSFLIGMSLSGRKEWKEVKVPDGSYFAWNKADLELSVPNNATLVAANGGMPSLLQRYKAPVSLPIPPEVASDMGSADVVLYMPRLPDRMGQDDVDQPAAEGGQMRLPIRDVWINAMKTSGGYSVAATVGTPSEQKAKVVALLLRVMIVAWLKGQNISDAAGRLQSISVLPEGALVKVRGITLSDAEILPLFFSFIRGEKSSPGPAS